MFSRLPPPTSECSRRPGNVLACVALLIVLSVCARVSVAQGRAIALQDATLFIGTGQVIEHGTVMFQDGEILAVGAEVKPSFLARKISVPGKYITPGLIDAGTTLALRVAPGANVATARALDAFDPYAADEMRAAWRDGVTAVYLPASTGAGIGGLAAIVRLGRPTESDDFVLAGEAELCATVGGANQPGPLVRVKLVEELRRRFQAAKDYRDAWDDYRDSLKEYEEKLAERAKKDAAAGKPDSGHGPAAKKGADEQKPDEPSADKKEPAKDELKKPTEPAKDRSAELLLRVLDGELRLRVEAHDPADILNVLDLAEEFGVALVLEGATGAHLVAERLAHRDVPVVLTAPPAPLAYTGGPERFARADAAALLNGAGVRVYFGSGAVPLPDGAPRLTLRVAQATRAGFVDDAGLVALTGGAARLLGVEKKIGRLATGLQADLVVWSAHPLSPGARVERVYVGGREVYRAEGGAEGQDE